MLLFVKLKTKTMKLKKELENELRELRLKIANIKEIPVGQRLFYCPNCGNPLLINTGAYTERTKHTFYCSVGHQFTFTS